MFKNADKRTEDLQHQIDLIKFDIEHIYNRLLPKKESVKEEPIACHAAPVYGAVFKDDDTFDMAVAVGDTLEEAIAFFKKHKPGKEIKFIKKLKPVNL